MGSKHWENTWTEIEDLGNGSFRANITVNHRVFLDSIDGQYKKRKLTDNRPTVDYVVVQSARCCVRVYPFYAMYYDVDNQEVRLYEERWVVQWYKTPPGNWMDVDAYNPIVTTQELSNGIVVTVDYDTDYGDLTVKYIQYDGSALKHEITFTNTSGSTRTFRVLQRWAGIVGAKCNGKDIPCTIDTPEEASKLRFHNINNSPKNFNVAENHWKMLFNEDGTQKTNQCLQLPISVDTHAQGMKGDFIYAEWELANNENLTMDPATETLDNPTVDGYIQFWLGSYLRFDTGEFTRSGYDGSRLYRAYVEWNTAAIPDGSTVTDTVFKYECDTRDIDCHIHEMLGCQPSTQADDQAGNQAIYDEAGEGTVYVDQDGFPELTFQHSIDLGVDADTDVENLLASDWFAIGIQSDNEGSSAQSQIQTRDDVGANPPPTLEVDYNPPAAGPAPAGQKAFNFGFTIIATIFRLILKGCKSIK